MSETDLHTYCKCTKCGAIVRWSKHSEADCETIRELKLALKRETSEPDLTIVIPGKPQPRQEQEFNTRGKKVRVYTPNESGVYMEKVRTCALQARRRAGLHEPISGMVELWITWVFHAPCRLRKAEREAVERGELFPHVGRTDEDNLKKNLYDGLKKVAIVDDRFIVRSHPEKNFGKEPRTIVKIRKLEV